MSCCWKNNDLIPTRSVAVLEAHANANKNFGHFRGHGHKQGKSFRMGGSRYNPSYNRNNHRKQNRDNGQKPTRKQRDICNL